MIFHKGGQTVIIEAKTAYSDTLADIPSSISCGQVMTKCCMDDGKLRPLKS